MAPQARFGRSASPTMPFLRGIALAGGNRSVTASPVTVPTDQGLDYCLRRGFNAFRLITLWEVLQPPVNGVPGPFDTRNIARIQGTIDHLTRRGAWVIIDPHNSMRYKSRGVDSDPGAIAGQSHITNAHFAAFWSFMATVFRGNPRVIYEVSTNEPHHVPDTALFAATVQAGIDAIRATGATSPILVDGLNYSGAGAWHRDGNAQAMLALTDPADALYFAPHVYMDQAGGTVQTCVAGEGSAQLAIVTQWARNHGRRLILGEFGGGDTPGCHAAIRETLDFVEGNRDVWHGWIAFTIYAGQPAYNNPDTLWLAMDPQMRGGVTIDDARITNAFGRFLSESWPQAVVDRIAGPALIAAGGTATNAGQARRFVEDWGTSDHGLATPPLDATADRVHVLQFDIRRDAGNRDILVRIADATGHRHAGFAIVSLDSGRVRYLGGSPVPSRIARPTVRTARLDDGGWRITVGVFVHDGDGSIRIAGSITTVANGLAAPPRPHPGDGTSAIRVWNAFWKVQ